MEEPLLALSLEYLEYYVCACGALHELRASELGVGVPHQVHRTPRALLEGLDHLVAPCKYIAIGQLRVVHLLLSLCKFMR